MFAIISFEKKKKKKKKKKKNVFEVVICRWGSEDQVGGKGSKISHFLVTFDFILSLKAYTPLYFLTAT